jgi:sortase B
MPSHTAKNNQREPKKRDLVSRLLLICGIILLLLALCIGGYLAWQYLDAQNRYREIQSVSGLEVAFGEKVESASELPLEKLHFDWDNLLERNPDTVGWIIVPGTQINYPVVQGANNEYYLYRLFDDTASGTGTVFSDYQGSKTLDAQNNLIYGHNMLDGSMFSDITMYTNQDFFDEHTVVYLGTPERNYELRTVATSKVDQNAPIRVFDFDSDADFTDFITEMLANPLAAAPDLDTVKQETQNLYSLVTCNTDNNTLRVVLSCIPVRSVVQE